MTVIDRTLFVCDNVRPQLLPGGTFACPFPLLVDAKYIDLQVAMDWARAKPLFANFRLAASYDAVADNTMSFAIFVDDNPGFVNINADPILTLVRGPTLDSGRLQTVGQVVQLAMPPLNTLIGVSAQGRRYVALGAWAAIPVADWGAGALDVFWTHEPFQTRPPAYATGY